MNEPRPRSTRVAAAIGALLLAFAVPVLLVLLAVTGPRWRPLLSALLTFAVVVPIVAFVLGLSNRRRQEELEWDASAPTRTGNDDNPRSTRFSR